MRYGVRSLCVLGLVCCLVGSVCAVSDSTDPIEDSYVESTVPQVALDDSTIAAIVDGLSVGLSGDDAVDPDAEPTEPPQVELTPEAVEALGDAVGVAVSEALEAAESAEADTPISYASTGISGGYYFVCDCALGTDVKFWIPADFAVDALALDDNGIVNMTNSTVYLMPDPDSGLSDYTIYASRFGHFQYRRTNYDYQDLRIRNITDTNITFLDDTQPRISDQVQFAVILAVLLLGFLMLVFIKRG